jgi:Ca2+-binding EF-hand superfamily protein
MTTISSNGSSIVQVMAMLQQLYHADTASTASSSSTADQNAATATAVSNSIVASGYLATGSVSSGNLLALLQSQSFDDAVTSQTTGQITDATYAKWAATADKDGNGVISESEFEAAVPSNVSVAAADQLYASIDTQGTGQVTAAQLSQGLAAAVASGPAAPTPTGGTNRLFEALDTNGDAQVTKTELENDRAAGLTQAQADALFSALDLNGDGKVTAAEFGQALVDASASTGAAGSSAAGSYAASQNRALAILSQLAPGNDTASLLDLFNSVDASGQTATGIQGSTSNLNQFLGLD